MRAPDNSVPLRSGKRADPPFGAARLKRRVMDLVMGSRQPVDPTRLGRVRRPARVALAVFGVGWFAFLIILSLFRLGDPPGLGWSEKPPAFGFLTAALTAPLAFQLWRVRWLARDIPAIEVTGAYTGLCKLRGYLVTLDPVESYVSGTSCVRYESEGTLGLMGWGRAGSAGQAVITDHSASLTLERDAVAKLPLRETYRRWWPHRMLEEKLCANGDEVEMLAFVQTRNGWPVQVRARDYEGRQRMLGLRTWEVSYTDALGQSTARLLPALGFTALAFLGTVSAVGVRIWSRPGPNGNSETVYAARFAGAGGSIAVLLASLVALAAVAGAWRWFCRVRTIRRCLRWADAEIATLEPLRPQLAAKGPWPEEYLLLENRVAALRRWRNDLITTVDIRLGQFPARLLRPLLWRHPPNLYAYDGPPDLAVAFGQAADSSSVALMGHS